MNKYILITGGTKGIGKSIAIELAKAGYNLILTYSSDKNAADEFKQILQNDFAIEVEVISADISQSQSLDIIDSFLEENNIKLFSIIFNAGITSRVSFEDIELCDWEKVFFANVHFPVFLIQRLLTDKLEHGGNIVFTGSLMGVYPHSVSLAYGVTKSSVHSLVQNMVKFMAPYKIRVNAIAPGFVDTEWQKTKPTEIRKRIEDKIALNRFCDPQELAQIYKLIIENSYLNGEIITVSGGYSYK